MHPQPEIVNELYCRQILEVRSRKLGAVLNRLIQTPGKNTIHDTRVESRRTRAALEAFRDLFPPRLWSAVYDGVRRVTRSLGKPRETQVSLNLLRVLASGGDMAENLCREYLEEHFLKILDRSSQKARKRLGARGARALQRKLNFLIAGLPPADPWRMPTTRRSKGAAGIRAELRSARQGALFELEESLAERARRVLTERAARILAFDTRRRFRRAPDAELHRLRIAIKRLRYAMEVFRPAWPGKLRSEIVCAKSAQDAGGRFQDLCVLRAGVVGEIRRLTRRETTHLAFQMGRLLSQIDDRRTSLREEILPALHRLQSTIAETLPDLVLPPGPTRKESAARATTKRRNGTSNRNRAPVPS